MKSRNAAKLKFVSDTTSEKFAKFFENPLKGLKNPLQVFQLSPQDQQHHQAAAQEQPTGGPLSTAGLLWAAEAAFQQ